MELGHTHTTEHVFPERLHRLGVAIINGLARHGEALANATIPFDPARTYGYTLPHSEHDQHPNPGCLPPLAEPIKIADLQ